MCARGTRGNICHTAIRDLLAPHFIGYVLRLLLLLSMLLLLGSLAACTPRGTKSLADGPRLTFQERSRSFGRLSASQKLEYRFAFTNTGSRLLEIREIRLEPATPGGCT
jgi:hypothetical protein